EEAPTGTILSAGAGVFAVARMYETQGAYLGEGGLSVEEVRDNWAKITDTTGQQVCNMAGDQSAKFFRLIQETEKA
ncbi:MAG: 3-oxoacyl-ACP reductase, partial [Phenylobacterium sp.]